MLRIVAIVLLLANGVYFAWTSGWLTGMGPVSYTHLTLPTSDLV